MESNATSDLNDKKPSAWFSQLRGSEGAGLSVSGASAVTERQGGFAHDCWRGVGSSVGS